MPGTMTLFGMMTINPHLFDDFAEPSDIDRENVLVPALLLACSELEPVYTDPYFLQKAIGVWSRSRYDSWYHIYTALNSEYDPIENYNRQEESGFNNETTGSTQNQNSAVEKVSAFDEEDFRNRSSEDESGMSTTKASAAGTNTSRIHGNIGVTTSQQMVQAELDLRKQGYVNIIATEFRNYFCVEVW